MFRSRRLPSSQWYLDSIEPFGLRIDKKGMCFGVSRMGMQALLARDVSTFDDRFFYLNRYTPDILYKKAQEAREREIIFILKIKLAFLSKDYLAEEINRFNKEELDAFNTSINAEITLLEPHKKSDLASLLKEKKREHSETLSNEEKLLLSIEPFFQGTVVQHDPIFFPQLIDDEHLLQPINQALDTMIPLFAPQLLDDLGGIKQAAHFSGLYSREELITYFRSLRQSLEEKNITEPVALFLGIYDHAITLSYDPQIKQWTFIDPNRLPSKPITDETELADEVMTSFPGHHQVSFSTDLFVTPAANADDAITTWLASDEMQAVHAVTPKKAQTTDSYFGSWLYSAVLHGDHDLVESLLQNGALPKVACEHGNTPFLVAAKRGDTRMLELLFKYGANINERHPEGMTALYLALARNNTDAALWLLQNGIDCNLADTKDTTPLHLAIFWGNVKVVKKLIYHGANTNVVRKEDHCTPLHLAIKKGDLALVKELVITGCVNPDEQFATVPVSYLLDIANKRGRQSEVEALITSKKGYWQLGLPANLTDLSELHLAVYHGHFSMVQFLLSCGADYRKTTYGITALELANALGRNDIAELIELKQLSDEVQLLPEDSSRRLAVEKFCILNEMREAKEASEEFAVFKELDGLAKQFIDVAEEFSHSNPSKAKRLMEHANKAYLAYANGKHDVSVIHNLKSEARKVSKKVQTAYEQGGGGFLKLFANSKSQFATRIETVIDKTLKVK